MLNGYCIEGFTEEEKGTLIDTTLLLKSDIRNTILDILDEDANVTSYEDVLHLALVLKEIAKLGFHCIKLDIMPEEYVERSYKEIETILRFNDILIKWLNNNKEQS